jgi:outer membrane lipoprotein SlyB
MKRLLLVAPLVLLGACTVMPTGPSIMALPGTGKSFDQFRFDDYQCREYANAQIGGATAQQAAEQSAVTSAAVGTAIGAAAGAAIGGSEGAATGAGVGLATGALAGTGAAQQSGYDLQWRYDMGYAQCMYAKGHRVPVAGSFEQSTSQPGYAAPAPPPPPPPTR